MDSSVTRSRLRGCNSEKLSPIPGLQAGVKDWQNFQLCPCSDPVTANTTALWACGSTNQKHKAHCFLSDVDLRKTRRPADDLWTNKNNDYKNVVCLTTNLFTTKIKVFSLTCCIENRRHTHTSFLISILIPKFLVNDLQNTNSHHPDGWVSPVSFVCVRIKLGSALTILRLSYWTVSRIWTVQNKNMQANSHSVALLWLSFSFYLGWSCRT